MGDLVHWERRDEVALLTLDRPEALNALSPAMLTAFAGAMRVIRLSRPGRPESQRCGVSAM